VHELEVRGKTLTRLRQEGEHLALAVALASELSRHAELERELDAITREMTTSQNDVRGRQRTGDLVNNIIDGLREASSDVIEVQLRRLEPLLQRIYATADPHPAFRAARLISRMRGGRGRVMPQIEDPMAKIESEAPETVLSSSQMNVLAVSVFLAFNLGMPALPLDTLVLDDPLPKLRRSQPSWAHRSAPEDKRRKTTRRIDARPPIWQPARAQAASGRARWATHILSTPPDSRG
jgi:hypothetical protein